MRYKFTFTQKVEALETCKAVIEADSKEEAVEKFNTRDFTSYLCVKREDIEISEEAVESIKIVKETD